jgi:hypothetical protein
MTSGQTLILYFPPLVSPNTLPTQDREKLGRGGFHISMSLLLSYLWVTEVIPRKVMHVLTSTRSHALPCGPYQASLETCGLHAYEWDIN